MQQAPHDGEGPPLDLDAASTLHAGVMSPHAAIEATGLTKQYGDHEVLRGVDLTVPAGTVYALLG